jgi:hypothetical protein
MNDNQIMMLRSALIFSALFTTLSLHPVSCQGLVRPVLTAWNRFKRFQATLHRPMSKKRDAQRFWEIDMSEFEP